MTSDDGLEFWLLATGTLDWQCVPLPTTAPDGTRLMDPDELDIEEFELPEEELELPEEELEFDPELPD